MPDPPFIIATMTHCSGKGRDIPARITASWRLAVAGIAAVAIAGAVNAIDDISLDIDRVQGDGWSAEGIVVSFGLPGENALARAKIDRLHIESFPRELRDVRIDCPQLDLSDTAIACKQARLDANWPGIGPQSLRASVTYERRNGALDVALDGIRLAQGQLSLRGSLRNAGWSGEADMQRVPIDLLVKIAHELQLPLPPLSASGLVTLTASGRGSHGELQEATVDGTLSEVTANNDSGSLATDQLSLQVQASIRGPANDLQFSLHVASGHGQAYAQPIFLDLGAHAFSLRAEGRLRDGRKLSIEHFVLDHADVAQASGQAVIRFDHPQPLRSLQLDLEGLEFPGAYASYFQPLLLDTSFKSMHTAGKIAGRIAIEEGAPRSVDLDFDRVSLDDGARSFALTELAGQWHWRSGGDTGRNSQDEGGPGDASRTGESNLHWRNGAVFGLALGEGDLQFVTNGRQFRLLRRARIPLLDGAIELESFRIRNAGTPKVAFMVDATIQPISVQQLCRAFGWPEFGGRVGGVISKLRMRNGVVTLGTTLRAQVFDGDVLIEDLRLEQPLGQWPRLYSSITLDNLDLELVTGAFSFGRITGRLSGAIEGLQLFNWTPVAFDARLYTPPDDRSKHRISQRAVENIGSIGGGGAGVTAALSSGFLRFFDDFNYERLGLSCRLENDVCTMSGIAAAPNGGYYLVKGRGLPRIDVIGSAHRVDWPRLVQQLIAVTESEGPVVN